MLFTIIAAVSLCQLILPCRSRVCSHFRGMADDGNLLLQEYMREEELDDSTQSWLMEQVAIFDYRSAALDDGNDGHPSPDGAAAAEGHSLWSTGRGPLATLNRLGESFVKRISIEKEKRASDMATDEGDEESLPGPMLNTGAAATNPDDERAGTSGGEPSVPRAMRPQEKLSRKSRSSVQWEDLPQRVDKVPGMDAKPVSASGSSNAGLGPAETRDSVASAGATTPAALSNGEGSVRSPRTPRSRGNLLPPPFDVKAVVQSREEIDMFELSTSDLCSLVYHLFEDCGALRFCDSHTLLNFINEVRCRMKSENPFHNLRHVVDVCYSVFRVLKLLVPIPWAPVDLTIECGTTSVHATRGDAVHPRCLLPLAPLHPCGSQESRELLEPLEVFALMLAAFSHDLEHPGVTNNFLIITRHKLSLRYNDSGVLENHHAATLFALLAEVPSANVTARMSDSAWRQLRRAVLGAVLHTDMTLHFKMVSQAEVFADLRREDLEAAANGDSAANARLFAAPEDKAMLLQLLLHMCDISNPVKKTDIFIKWSNAIMAEFFQQGDMEQSLGLRQSPGFDRHTTSPALSQARASTPSPALCSPVDPGGCEVSASLSRPSIFRRLTLSTWWSFHCCCP